MTAVDYRGQTTLITGASSGIGVEFARSFAWRGSDVVLVARRLDRLEKLSAELAATYGVRATAIPLDLSLPAAGRTLAQEVDRRGLAVTSLVNNAGFGTFGPFHAEDPERLREEIGVDVASVVDVSRAFIERLRAAGTGVLINVASLAAYGPIPNMAVYAATKAFVLSFTEALWQESLGTGLRVIALSPGATRTEFFEVVGTDRRTAARRGSRRRRSWLRCCGRWTAVRRRPASSSAG
jgi:short-subunit dehydrogenase